MQRVLEELEQPDDEDDRRHDERHERHEADERAEPRQLEVHPVDRRHEEQQSHHDRLDREPERELERRPELRIVEDDAVVAEGAALPRVGILQAEEERRNQGNQEVRRSDDEPEEGGRGDSRLAHFAHRDARRCSGTYRSIIPASTKNIPNASAWPSCGFERTLPERSLPIRIGTSGSPVPLVSAYAVA